MANADQTIEGDLEVIYTFLSKSCSSDALGRIASSVSFQGFSESYNDTFELPKKNRYTCTPLNFNEDFLCRLST